MPLQGWLFEAKHDPRRNDYIYKFISTPTAKQLAITYEFQDLPYQRPRPYQPPPSSRTRSTMMRSVVISMGNSYSVAVRFPRSA
jgi:hypothetical protein